MIKSLDIITIRNILLLNNITVTFNSFILIALSLKGRLSSVFYIDEG